MDGVRVDIGVAGAYGMGWTAQPLQPESAKMINAQANANRAIKPLTDIVSLPSGRASLRILCESRMPLETCQQSGTIEAILPLGAPLTPRRDHFNQE